MKPDRKFMQTDTDDLDFVPLDLNNPFTDSSIDFLNIINESTSSDLRGTLDLDSTTNDLYSYNKNFSYRNDGYKSIPSDILRDLGLGEDEFDALECTESDASENTDSRYINKCNPEIIFDRILKSEPEILNTLKRYRIPFPIAKRLIKRIISMTLQSCYNNNTNDSYYNYDRE